jgi:hypothetical protein
MIDATDIVNLSRNENTEENMLKFIEEEMLKIAKCGRREIFLNYQLTGKEEDTLKEKGYWIEIFDIDVEVIERFLGDRVWHTHFITHISW